MLLAGCGSADTLPPPEAPPSTAGSGARLDTRARTLTVGGDTANAGVGPTQFAETRTRVYVIDAVQHALLVFAKEPELRLQRRAWLPSRPEGLTLFGALDREPIVIVRLASDAPLAFTPGGFER